LKERHRLGPEGIYPREKWLVGELLALVEMLVGKVERGERLTRQEVAQQNAVRTEVATAGYEARPAMRSYPWLLRVERVLFGRWEMVSDGQVRCIYCGSTWVGRKSKQPRWKKYTDQEGNLQQVAVYRYYCRNPACDKGSFTDLPPGLVPYSRYRVEPHLLALQMYAWGYRTYRRTASALQVSPTTVYRWVSAWGYRMMPIAAMFGVVKSSGVIGVDEKYVLVPHNEKPAGKMRRWMYVYLAVDAYSYDLLHCAIYEHNTAESAQAFMLALRVKGYQPRVVVTDLRRDYRTVIAQVFPHARHHECLFHALQEIHRQIKEIYGSDYAQTYPQVLRLEQEIKGIFKAKTKRTAQKRRQQVLSQRKRFVAERAAAAALFDFLVNHWPTLVNGIESKIIPRTNNATEMVIRRFDHHYQNFCGFETIGSAQLFLGVFEKVYRCTPFSQDAQPEIRGRSPLELAGYDLSQWPIVPLFSGQSIIWPLNASDVPNS
jgi:transposase-like protein